MRWSVHFRGCHPSAAAVSGCREGLVMAMAMGPEYYSRQHVVDLLNRLGHDQLSEEASWLIRR